MRVIAALAPQLAKLGATWETELQRQVDSVASQHEAEYEAARKTHALRVLELDRKVGSLTDEMASGGFDAVFLAVGAHLGKRAYIPANRKRPESS